MKRKKISFKAVLATVCALMINQAAQAQGTLISDGPVGGIDPSAVLDIRSTDPANRRGLLIPRMTENERLNNVVTPTGDGLMVYQINGTPTSARGFYYWDATNNQWSPLGASAAGITANNGLTLTGTNVQLGGTLLQHTTVELGNFDMIFSSTPLNSGDFIVGSSQIDHNVPGSGINTRMFFHKSTGSFRAGATTLTSWDKSNLGLFSFASGLNTLSTNTASTAMGDETKALGYASFAIGNRSEATGNNSVAIGQQNLSTDLNAVAIGIANESNGIRSVSIGESNKATNSNSAAIGSGNEASGVRSMALGDRTKSTGYASVSIGSEVEATGNYSLALGHHTFASGENSTSMGNTTYAMTDNQIAVGRFNIPTTTPPATTADAQIFTIGNGSDGDPFYTNTSLIQDNALVVYANGDVQIPDLPSDNGTTKNRNVVVDANGRLRTVPANTGGGGTIYNEGGGIDIDNTTNTITADVINGLTIQTDLQDNDDKIYLGGPLVQNTNVNMGAGTTSFDMFFGGDGTFVIASEKADYDATNLVASGTGPNGSLYGATGGDTRTFFNAKEGAFRTGGTLAMPGLNVGGVASGLVWDYAAGHIGAYSFAAGFSNLASGAGSNAFGALNSASGDFSFVGGQNAEATGERSFAVGYQAIASGAQAVALGIGTEATAANSVALNSQTNATGINSVAINSNSTASGENSFSAGLSSEAIGGNSVAINSSSVASGENSFSAGNRTNAASLNSVAMGLNTLAEGENAMALNEETQAIGRNSTAMGLGSRAEGENSLAIGITTNAVGNNSLSVGEDGFARGLNSMTIGTDCETGALGNSAFAQGIESQAMARGAVAMGEGCHSIGDYSITQGFRTNASSVGEVSVGIGGSTYTGNPNNWVATDRIFRVARDGVQFGGNRDALTILKNGNVYIGSDYDNNNHNASRSTGGGSGVLYLSEATAPTSNLVGTGKTAIWNDGGSIMVRDGAGNSSVISPHNFSAIPDGASEKLAWSFYSEREEDVINVDMCKVVRLVEQMSGENLVYLSNKTTGEVKVKDLENSLQSEIDTLKAQNTSLQKQIDELVKLVKAQ